jgi:hypothetical protein
VAVLSHIVRARPLLKAARELAISSDSKAARLKELMLETGELSGEQLYLAISGTIRCQ